MWILVLKWLKQAIEAHTATVYLHLNTMNCQELFPAQLPPPHPGWDTRFTTALLAMVCGQF